MIDRLLLGRVPEKPHIAFRDDKGALFVEECITRKGFESAYSIAYHRRAPTSDESLTPSERGWQKPVAASSMPQRRLFLSDKVALGKRPLDSHTVLLTNPDVDAGVVRATESDNAFLANNDGDDLYYVFSGSALLQTPLGELTLAAGDYLWVPRSLPYRFLEVRDIYFLHFEVKHGLKLPAQYRNELGQLKMDAPYSHRDFVRPSRLPEGEGPSEVVIKRGGQFFLRRHKETILDVVGFDGFVYPVTFNIERFQAKTGLVHLPPPVHATFAAEGLVICSFVPRLLDTHPQAIPCPYPHSSVDCDEMLFYCRGNFTSRRGVGPGAISLHPAGLAHGPQPGAYEASIGVRRTDELAVMLDTFKPLEATIAAASVEHVDYHASWRHE